MLPLGRGEGVVIAGAGLIVTANGLLAKPLAVSRTCTVKLNVPVLAGVPLSTPVELRDAPAGSGPPWESNVQVKAPMPPVAFSVRVNGPPRVPAGRGEGVVIVMGGVWAKDGTGAAMPSSTKSARKKVL